MKITKINKKEPRFVPFFKTNDIVCQKSVSHYNVKTETSSNFAIKMIFLKKKLFLWKILLTQFKIISVAQFKGCGWAFNAT